MTSRGGSFLLCLPCFFLFDSFISPAAGAASLQVKQACSHVPPDPLMDMFEDEPGDLSWPRYSPRHIKARTCHRRSGFFHYDLKHESRLTVDCGKCAIFDLDVRAKKANRNCWGLVAELFQSRQNCLFQNKCQLDYRNSIITWSLKNERSCLLQWPDTLEVATACLDTEHNPVIDVIKSVQRSESRTGFISSHPNNKRSRIKYEKKKDLSSPNNTLVLIPPDSRNDQTFLLLHFHMFHLAKGDSLQVLGSSLDCHTAWSENGTYAVHSGNSHRISLVFSVGESEQSGEGFEVCFQWFTSGNETSALKQFEETLTKCNRYRRTHKARKDLPVYEVIQTNSSQDTTGVVRSHPGFPWNYPRPLAPSWGWGWDKNKKGLDLLNPGRDKNCPRHWNIVRHELRAPAKMTTLRLTVGRLRLARGDRLDVCSENGSVYRVKRGESYNIQSPSVILSFSIKVSHLSTNQGFMLCYKWFSSPYAVAPVETDLCKSFALKVGCRKTRRRKSKGKSRRKRRVRPSVRTKLPRKCRR